MRKRWNQFVSMGCRYCAIFALLTAPTTIPATISAQSAAGPDEVELSIDPILLAPTGLAGGAETVACRFGDTVGLCTPHRAGEGRCGRRAFGPPYPAYDWRQFRDCPGFYPVIRYVPAASVSGNEAILSSLTGRVTPTLAQCALGQSLECERVVNGRVTWTLGAESHSLNAIIQCGETPRLQGLSETPYCGAALVFGPAGEPLLPALVATSPRSNFLTDPQRQVVLRTRTGVDLDTERIFRAVSQRLSLIGFHQNRLTGNHLIVLRGPGHQTSDGQYEFCNARIDVTRRHSPGRGAISSAREYVFEIWINGLRSRRRSEPTRNWHPYSDPLANRMAEHVRIALGMAIDTACSATAWEGLNVACDAGAGQ